MIRKAAMAVGVILTLIGILGFIPALTPKDASGMPVLLSIFMVGILHNIIHLATGLAGMLASKYGKYASLYFRVFGVVYALVTLIGFVQKNTVLGLFDINMADNILHLVIAAVYLYLGFAIKPVASTEAA